MDNAKLVQHVHGPVIDRSHALRGNAALDAQRQLVDRSAYASAGDAERRGLAPTRSVGAICRFP